MTNSLNSAATVNSVGCGWWHWTAKHEGWAYLIAAIACELVGLTVMKLSMSHQPVFGHLTLYLLVGLAYVLLSKAVRRISVGIAYAVWEGSGIVVITLISWWLFAHELAVVELLGLALAVIGIVLVNAGHTHEGADEVRSHCHQAVEDADCV